MANRWDERQDAQGWRDRDRDHNWDRDADFDRRPQGDDISRNFSREEGGRDWRDEEVGQPRRSWDPANYGDLDRERGPGRDRRGPYRTDEYRNMDFARAFNTPDRREKGPHRGKGPKGYTRSDERIREDLSDRLADDDMVDASEITVSVAKGEVTLDGTVASRAERRAAEDCADECSGVTHVQNNLRVRDAGQAGPPTQTAASRARTRES